MNIFIGRNGMQKHYSHLERVVQNEIISKVHRSSRN